MQTNEYTSSPFKCYWIFAVWLLSFNYLPDRRRRFQNAKWALRFQRRWLKRVRNFGDEWNQLNFFQLLWMHLKNYDNWDYFFNSIHDFVKQKFFAQPDMLLKISTSSAKRITTWNIASEMARGNEIFWYIKKSWQRRFFQFKLQERASGANQTFLSEEATDRWRK